MLRRPQLPARPLSPAGPSVGGGRASSGAAWCTRGRGGGGGQRLPLPLLLLHAAVLEPDLHLGVAEAQRAGHLEAAGPRQVPAEVKLLLQLRELPGAEAGARRAGGRFPSARRRAACNAEKHRASAGVGEGRGAGAGAGEGQGGAGMRAAPARTRRPTHFSRAGSASLASTRRCGAPRGSGSWVRGCPRGKTRGAAAPRRPGRDKGGRAPTVAAGSRPRGRWTWRSPAARLLGTAGSRGPTPRAGR